MKDTLFKYCTVVAKCITCIAQSLLVGTRRQRLVLCVCLCLQRLWDWRAYSTLV
jgi:hypothetical protein